MLEKLSKNAKITLSILLAFIGISLLSFTYFDTIKSNLFNYKNIQMLEQRISLAEVAEEVVEEPIEESSEEENTEEKHDAKKPTNKDKKNNYIGYLEVPDVNIKRGFLSFYSKYNSIRYNVMLIEGSTMPDVKNGNLILAAHRGSSSVSFFDKLYKIKDKARAYITYNNKRYTYELAYRYTELKDGSLTIRRDAKKNILTLITCTRNDKKTQTIFIFELVSVE